MITSQQQRNCQLFLNKLFNTKTYEMIKNLLFVWRDDNKKSSMAIDTFIKIFRAINQNEEEQKLLQSFNKCLAKDVMPLYISPSLQKVKQMAVQNPHSIQILDNVYEWLKKDKKSVNESIMQVQPQKFAAIEQIKDSMLLAKLQQLPNHTEIIKIIQIYLRSIINIEEVKKLLVPLIHKQPNIYNFIIQTAEQTRVKRKRFTIFAPLNQLVDQKYPIQQVGGSYVLIPDGYANYSIRWSQNPLEGTMNRKCISVPLGSEVSFTIHKKTQEEEKLLSYEDQRYEIDSNLQSLIAVIKIVKKQERIQSPLLKKIIYELYPNQNVYNFFIRHLSATKNILLPRLQQKEVQLREKRACFIKTCQEISKKNFYISLDYRGFYFAKNDRKFNSAQRWQKQIQMRKQQIMEGIEKIDENSAIDRQALQHGRDTYVNSFDNITKEQFIKNKSVDLKYDRKQRQSYPQFPDNQILFICNFENQEVMNDALEIILYFCPSRRNLLETLVFKMMKKDIKRRIQKNNYLLRILEMKDKIKEIHEIKDLMEEENKINEHSLLNAERNQKNNRDSEDQFMDMIEQDLEPALIEDSHSPFQGPNDHTFIGTKTCYLFLRYLTTVYQRFLKAKEYAEVYKQNQCSEGVVDLYEFFLVNLINKTRDKKAFEQNLRKIYCKDSFIFFTLDKIIQSAAKLINAIPLQSLTDRIIKDLTKDFEHGLLEWNTFQFPTVKQQLTRLYNENETLFRFTFVEREQNFYVSAWNPKNKQVDEGQTEQIERKISQFIVGPQKIIVTQEKQRMIVDNSEQVCFNNDGLLLIRGELMTLKRYSSSLKELQLEAEIKKLIKRVKIG